MHLQIDPAQSASITVMKNGVHTELAAHILSTSGRKMTIAVDSGESLEGQIEVGGAVKVQWSQYLVLAEIIGTQGPNHVLQLQIRHALKTDDIDYIRQRWA